MRILFLCLLLVGLTACSTSSPEDVMPTVTYAGKVSVHSKQSAQLYWQTGKQAVESDPSTMVISTGLVGAVVATSFDTLDRERNPGKYNFSFGKAQQAVFMTSLRDVLVQQKVFQDTQLVTALPKAAANQTLITVYFKSTRAEPASGDYQVTLDVVLRVQSKQKPAFERTYFVQSDLNAKDTSYKGQQLDASKKLMQQLLSGIATALDEVK